MIFLSFAFLCLFLLFLGVGLYEFFTKKTTGLFRTLGFEDKVFGFDTASASVMAAGICLMIASLTA